MTKFSHKCPARFPAAPALCYVELSPFSLAELTTGVVAASILPVSVWILLNGIDDLVVLCAFLIGWLRRTGEENGPLPTRVPERPIAIFVPCWGESQVIGDMVEHNISALRYGEYHFFVGGYPNDEATLDAVRRLENRHANVHLCLCPHDGPTSKADCLNWIYQRMLLFEDERGLTFHLIVTHDAEDITDPDELTVFNLHSDRYDMIQTPVLPLPTPWKEFTHGLYCDDFAESHTKDLPARVMMGGFLPSCGVGTAYTRAALDKLADAASNRIFEPASLTEDYENGLRLHRLGCRQLFLPLGAKGEGCAATREYFPRTFRDAMRQRTRWVTGIALQTWARHGWKGPLARAYSYWRDRKGLAGAPVSLAANLLAAYGALTGAASLLTGEQWALGAVLRLSPLREILAANLVLLGLHLSTRIGCVGRIYGWRFATGVPIRAIYGNCLNAAATLSALYLYARCRWRGEPLRWVKTEHAYPSRAALLPHKRTLEEILLGSGYLDSDELAQANSTKPAGIRLSEHLVHAGFLSEEELYEALSLQLGLTLGRIEPHEVRRNVARCLPVHVVREWSVLPIRIEAGSLHLASLGAPSENLHSALQRFTRLNIQIEMVTPTNFRRLSKELL